MNNDFLNQFHANDLTALSAKIAALGGDEKAIHALLCETVDFHLARAIVSDGGANPVSIWTPEDLTGIFPEMTFEQRQKAMADSRKRMEERLSELGYEVLEVLVNPADYAAVEPETESVEIEGSFAQPEVQA